MLSEESPRIIKRDFRGIGSDGGYLIGSAMGRDDSGFYADNEEADANAHLIAAAPDMYEALADLVNAFDGEPGFGPAKDALAKARGKS